MSRCRKTGLLLQSSEKQQKQGMNAVNTRTAVSTEQKPQRFRKNAPLMQCKQVTDTAERQYERVCASN